MVQRLSNKQLQLVFLFWAILFWLYFLIVVLNGTRETSHLMGLIVLSVIIAFILLLVFKHNNKYEMVLALLYHFCMPERFITKIQNILTEEERKKRPKDKYRLLLYLAKGYYAAGKFQEAMDTINGIELFYHYKNAGYIAGYFHNKFLISLELERQDIAWGSLVKMREAIINIKKRKFQDQYTRLYTEDIHILNVEKGNYEGAEEMFISMFKRGQTNYECSFASFLLGVVYAHLGNEDDAKFYYKYVVEYGNKLYIADKAAELLRVKG
jgi:tetratricopeptide (TPR) repeat protein